MVIDAAGNIYVTGRSDGSGTSTDYATIKYSQTVGIEPISQEIPSSYSLSQNYPNPFNPATKIRFNIPLSRGVSALGGRGVYIKLVVYNISGKEILILINQQIQPGTYEVDFDGTGLPSGVYFYQLVAGDFAETRKMLLVK